MHENILELITLKINELLIQEGYNDFRALKSPEEHFTSLQRFAFYNNLRGKKAIINGQIGCNFGTRFSSPTPEYHNVDFKEEKYYLHTIDNKLYSGSQLDELYNNGGNEKYYRYGDYVKYEESIYYVFVKTFIYNDDIKLSISYKLTYSNTDFYNQFLKYKKDDFLELEIKINSIDWSSRGEMYMYELSNLEVEGDLISIISLNTGKYYMGERKKEEDIIQVKQTTPSKNKGCSNSVIWGHIIIALFTIWWTYGIGNLIFHIIIVTRKEKKR